MNEDPCSPGSPGSPESSQSNVSPPVPPLSSRTKNFRDVFGSAHPLSTKEPGLVNEFILLKNYLFSNKQLSTLQKTVPTNQDSYLGFSEKELRQKLEEFYKDKQGNQWPRLFHTPERANQAFRDYLKYPDLYIQYQSFLDKFTCRPPAPCFLLVSSDLEAPHGESYLQSAFKTRVPFMQPIIPIWKTDDLKTDPFFVRYILPMTEASPDIKKFLESNVNQKGGRSRLKVQSTRRKQRQRKSRKNRKNRKTRRAY
jgi:hypothetical protein